jgi:hypothetical protein
MPMDMKAATSWHRRSVAARAGSFIIVEGLRLAPVASLRSCVDEAGVQR